jgi:tRNA threonylcarbamoyladenosine modification (KEOPS) complex  Pcc1 subunit
MHTKGTVHILNVLQGGAKPRLGPSVAFQNKSKCKIYSKIRSLKVRALSLNHYCITIVVPAGQMSPRHTVYSMLKWIGLAVHHYQRIMHQCTIHYFYTQCYSFSSSCQLITIIMLYHNQLLS